MMKRFGGVAKQGKKKGKRRSGPALPNLKQLQELQQGQAQGEESALDILRRS